MVITMAKLRMAHASTHGARKPPGPKKKRERKKERAKVGDNNGQATHGARKHAWRKQADFVKLTFVNLVLTKFNRLFKLNILRCIANWKI